MTVLLDSLVQTAVQTSTSAHLVPVSTMECVLKSMVQQLNVFVLRDLMAQDVTLIFHSVRCILALMVAHAMKDPEP